MKGRLLTLFGVGCLIANSNLYSQTYFSKTIDVIEESESGWQLISSDSNSYLLGVSFCDGAKPCSHILKLNSNYDTIWTQTLFGLGPGNLTSLIKSDSALWVFGVQKDVSDTLGLSIVKLDFTGKVINKIFLGTRNNDIPKGIVLSNSSYFIAFIENVSSDSNVLWVYKYTLNDQFLWKRKYEIPGKIYNVHSIEESQNYGAILGCSRCVDLDCSLYIGFLLDITSDGDIRKYIERDTVQSNIFTYTYALSDSSDYILSRYSKLDNSFLGKPTIYKFNESGIQLWKYGFDSYENIALNSISVSNDHSILGVGVNENHPFIDTSSEEQRYGGGWIFRINKIGNLEWNKIYGDLRLPGPSFGELSDGFEDKSRDIISVGYTFNYLQDSSQSKITLDIWILKLNEEGCITDFCQDGFNGINIIDRISELQFQNNLFDIYPNPSTGTFAINYQNSKDVNNLKRELIISNSSGTILMHLFDNDVNNSIHLAYNGIYFITLRIGNKIQTNSLIIQN